MHGIMGGRTKPAKTTPNHPFPCALSFQALRCYAVWSHIITESFPFIGSGLAAFGKGGRHLFEPNDPLCSYFLDLRSKTFLLSFGGVGGWASLSSSFSSVALLLP